MVLLGEAAAGAAHLLELDAAIEPEDPQRAHFVAAAGAVAGPGPFPLCRLAIAGIAPLVLGFAPRRLLGAEVREIIPVPVIFGGVRLAEIPALAAVRRLGRGLVADRAATHAVAQAHARGVAALAVRPPARESPVVRSFLLGHRASLASDSQLWNQVF